MKFADYPDHVAQELADERDDFIVMISEPPMDEACYTCGGGHFAAHMRGCPDSPDAPDYDAINDDRRFA